ncbi:hypothetical protein KAJ77_09650, partial [bacterium]|nr:hypothetical protein [bacterium]
MAVAFYLNNILAINDAEQSIVLDAYIVYRWQDAHFADPARGEFAVPCPLPLDRMWTPRIQTDNLLELKKLYEDVTTIDGNGLITAIIRVLAEVSETFDLREFPRDSHVVTLALWPMLSNESELLFTPLKSLTGQAETLSVSGWDVGEGEARVLSQRRERLGRQFSRFEYQFRVGRQLGFFIYKLLAPLALIVLMAGTVFLLPSTESRPQIGIGITSMLTLIAYQFASADMLPHISYLTRADHFIFGAWILVFLALVKSIFTSCMVHQDKSELVSKVDTAGRWAYAAAFILILSFA